MKRLLIIAILALAACSSEPPLSEGRVVDREFDPEHTEHYTETHYRTEYYEDCGYDSEYNFQTGQYEQVYSCESESRQVPYYVDATRRVDDDWDIQIEGCTTNDKGEEKCRTSWIDVSRAVYEECELRRLYKEGSGCRPR